MMRARLRKPEAGALTSALLHFSEKSSEPYARWKPRGGTIHDFFFLTQSVGAAVLKREAWEKVGGYDESMTGGLEDWEFFFRLTAAGYAVRTAWKAQYHYHHHSKSLTSSYTEEQLEQALNYFFQKHRTLYESTPPLRPLLSLLSEVFRNPSF